MSPDQENLRVWFLNDISSHMSQVSDDSCVMDCLIDVFKDYIFISTVVGSEKKDFCERKVVFISDRRS